MPFEIDFRESEIFQMGEKEALTIVLTERFGQLTPTIVEQIKPAARPQLDRWFRQSVSARSLSEIFPE